eukprot:7771010-Alexandrium_andersonii.AAC.1
MPPRCQSVCMLGSHRSRLQHRFGGAFLFTRMEASTSCARLLQSAPREGRWGGLRAYGRGWMCSKGR